MNVRQIIAAYALTVVLAVPAQAESLAKQAQNPVANLISLPLQNNSNFGVGPDDRTQNVLNVQPVWPIKLNEDWNVITRTILPITSQPLPGGGRENGLGDATFSAFLSPRAPGKVIWGAGPVLLIPTSTDDALGLGEWGGGLSAVALATPGPWVFGSLFSNVWADSDDSSRSDINLFTWQYFVNYNIPDGDGLYLVSSPIITANWEADSNNRWTVPFGGGIGKIFRIGKQPVNASVAAFYNVEKPTNGPDWQLRAQLQFLFPK